MSKVYSVKKSDPEGIRTPNRQSRNLIFYPVELLGQFIFKEVLGGQQLLYQSRNCFSICLSC